jgi:glycine cleavage system H protein
MPVPGVITGDFIRKGGYMVQEGLFYTKEHEWVKITGDEAIFGISDHAQNELGDITFVELPEKDKEIKQFQEFASVESVKAASDIYAPLSGTVLAVNEALQDAPEALNSSPYGEGWICRVKIANPDEKRSLMNADEYKTYLEETAQ